MHYTKQLFLLAVMTLLLVGCATTSAPRKAIDPETVFKGNNFTLTSSNEPNWVVIRSDPFNVQLHKKMSLESIDQSHVVSMSVRNIGEIKTIEEFSYLVKQSRAMDKLPNRFKLLENREEVDNSKPDYCVKFYSRIEDGNAKRASKRTDVMILDDVGFICRSPSNKKIVLNYYYSHRHYPGQEDPELNNKRKRFFESVVIR